VTDISCGDGSSHYIKRFQRAVRLVHIICNYSMTEDSTAGEPAGRPLHDALVLRTRHYMARNNEMRISSKVLEDIWASDKSQSALCYNENKEGKI
jgi:hypothetical protein